MRRFFTFLKHIYKLHHPIVRPSHEHLANFLIHTLHCVLFKILSCGIYNKGESSLVKYAGCQQQGNEFYDKVTYWMKARETPLWRHNDHVAN